MPNVGFGELLVIGLIALIVFGPNKLPEMMRSMGKALRAFQDESRNAMNTLRTGMDDGAPAAPTAPAPGVIDTADGFTPATPAPNGAASKPRAQRAHAPRKRPSAAKRRATPVARKTSGAAKRAAPAKRATPQKRVSKPRSNGKSSGPREAHEDT